MATYKNIEVTFEDKALGVRLYHWDGRYWSDTQTISKMLDIDASKIYKAFLDIGKANTFKTGSGSTSKLFIGTTAFINLVLLLAMQGNSRAQGIQNWIGYHCGLDNNSLFLYFNHYVQEQTVTKEKVLNHE